MGYNKVFVFMKKFYVTCIVALVMALCFSSCNRTENLLVGTWRITNFTYIDNGDPETDSWYEDELWTFYDNGMFKGTLNDEYNLSCNYTCRRDRLVLKDGDLYEDSDDYTEYVFDIDEITNTDLHVSGTFYWYEDEDVFTEDISVKLKKKN